MKEDEWAIWSEEKVVLVICISLMLGKGRIFCWRIECRIAQYEGALKYIWNFVEKFIWNRLFLWGIYVKVSDLWRKSLKDFKKSVACKMEN